MSDCFVTTPVKGGTCPRCRSLILTGWAEGLAAAVDLIPLNPAGELHALLDRRPTYTLTRTGLAYRDSSRIAGNHLRGPILAAHRCGARIAPEHRAPPGDAPPVNPDRPPY